MRAAYVVSMTPAPSLPTHLNKLCGCSLARALLINMRKRKRSVLLGRVYVTDSRIRSQVGRWYRVLRYRKAFSFADSIRYGLWLARG